MTNEKCTYELVQTTDGERYALYPESRRIDYGHGHTWVAPLYISKAAGDRLVYLPKRGNRFHWIDSCSKTTEIKEVVTRVEAEARGYVGCKLCEGCH